MPEPRPEGTQHEASGAVLFARDDDDDRCPAQVAAGLECGPVAQWLEPTAHNGLVAGSSPAGPTTISPLQHPGNRPARAPVRGLPKPEPQTCESPARRPSGGVVGVTGPACRRPRGPFQATPGRRRSTATRREDLPGKVPGMRLYHFTSLGHLPVILATGGLWRGEVPVGLGRLSRCRRGRLRLGLGLAGGAPHYARRFRNTRTRRHLAGTVGDATSRAREDDNAIMAEPFLPVVPRRSPPD